MRIIKLHVNRATIQRFAQKARVELREKTPSEEVREKYSNFRASAHWVTSFLFRRDLASRTLHGEASSVAQATIASRMQEIHHACES